MAVTATKALQDQIAALKSSGDVSKSIATESASDIPVGTACKNNSCKMVGYAHNTMMSHVVNSLNDAGFSNELENTRKFLIGSFNNFLYSRCTKALTHCKRPALTIRVTRFSTKASNSGPVVQRGRQILTIFSPKSAVQPVSMFG